jgi:hypothetical protein
MAGIDLGILLRLKTAHKAICGIKLLPSRLAHTTLTICQRSTVLVAWKRTIIRMVTTSCG